MERKTTPAPGAPGGAGRRSGGGKGAAGSGGGGRGRGRGRGGGGGSERSAGGISAAIAPSEDAPRSNAKGKHDKSKRKGGGGGGNANAGSSANQQRGSTSARPTRAANAVVRKVLIRNIPHTTEQEEILALVEAHGVAKESVWRFVAGKVRGSNRQPTTGRMYLDLKKDSEQARKLIAALNGHVISESKEGRVALEVEFAPYQKIPSEKQRKDAKTGTIDRDPEYLAFLEELSKPKEKLPSAELVADATDPAEVVEKPIAALVKYMNERKVHSRDKGKGKSGKSFEKGGAAKRQTRKKEQKPAKEKTKSSKDRRKTTEAAAADAAKPRKTRGARSSSKKETPSSESVEPGMVRIMAPKAQSTKSSAAASESPAQASKASSASAAAPESKDKGKKASGGGGAGNAATSGRGRGKGRGSERPQKETKAAEASNGGGGGGGDGGGETKPPRRRDSRASAGGGNAGGKKDGAGKSGGGERKKKVFVPKEPSNQSG